MFQDRLTSMNEVRYFTRLSAYIIFLSTNWSLFIFIFIIFFFWNKKRRFYKNVYRFNQVGMLFWNEFLGIKSENRMVDILSNILLHIHFHAISPLSSPMKISACQSRCVTTNDLSVDCNGCNTSYVTDNRSSFHFVTFREFYFSSCPSNKRRIYLFQEKTVRIKFNIRSGDETEDELRKPFWMGSCFRPFWRLRRHDAVTN